jgi:hypothetical protein
MKRIKFSKEALLVVGSKILVCLIFLKGLNQTALAQIIPGHLFGQVTIGENPTLLTGNMVIAGTGELFLGSSQPRLKQTLTLYHIGNYMGETGARIYHSITDNSNNYGSRGFFDVVGTAVGTTEIILDMFDSWDGSRIDLARAYNENSDIDAFVMQEGIYNGHSAQLKSRVEGGDRVWFIEAQPDEDCLSIILQKKNKTLAVDNNAKSNGGHNFSYYKWFKNDKLIHEGTYGTGLGGIYNTGKNTDLSPYDTYYVLLIDQYGKEHRTCPYNPTVFRYDAKITAYPNPATTSQSLVAVDVETDDEELLANGTITAYDIVGHRIGQDLRTNGHRITPVQLPAVSGVYVVRFVSGDFQTSVKVIVNK